MASVAPFVPGTAAWAVSDTLANWPLLVVTGTLATTSTTTDPSAGSVSMRRPSMSFTWLEKMLTAMPAVKPVTTGCGMYFISVPSRSRPAAISISPASRVHRISPP